MQIQSHCMRIQMHLITRRCPVLLSNRLEFHCLELQCVALDELECNDMSRLRRYHSNDAIEIECKRHLCRAVTSHECVCHHRAPQCGGLRFDPCWAPTHPHPFFTFLGSCTIPCKAHRPIRRRQEKCHVTSRNTRMPIMLLPGENEVFREGLWVEAYGT